MKSTLVEVDLTFIDGCLSHWTKLLKLHRTHPPSFPIHKHSDVFLLCHSQHATFSLSLMCLTTLNEHNIINSFGPQVHQKGHGFSVLWGHVDVLRAGLLCGDAPSVDVVVPLLLLLALRTLLLQLLPLVLGPPVLEPHFHLQHEKRHIFEKHKNSCAQSSQSHVNCFVFIRLCLLHFVSKF